MHLKIVIWNVMDEGPEIDGWHFSIMSDADVSCWEEGPHVSYPDAAFAAMKRILDEGWLEE